MEKEFNQYNTIFALDIGTNSVVGILGTSNDQEFTITHSVIKFHKKRAMVDGQIHDIPSVLEIVRKVKEQLEKEVGFSLKQVSIAAAGRALRTMKLSESIPLNQNREITRDQIKLLEFEALKKAHEKMNVIQDNPAKYFCVGHSLIKFDLDEMDITNPIGQKGKELTGHIIATFLPEIVVESLHTVMAKAGLEVDCLTLEPIAALDIIVPENIRLLNIALVDVGAGTSDIAITKDGTVVGYGMTGVAGDEITEEIAKTFLLGFDQSEALKCKLSSGEEHIITNIIGETLKVSTKEVLEKIRGRIDSVAEKIAKEIMEINGKATSAVFLVGGGSQIPGISEGIARHLGLPDNRVVMKTIEDIEAFTFNTINLTGPEAITPLGIFRKSMKDHGENFIEIDVNNKRLKMFQRNNLKVGDALALANVDPRTFIPGAPKEVTIILEGRKMQIASPEDQSVCIILNESIVGIDAPIKNRDRIHIEYNHTRNKSTYTLRTLLPEKWHENYTFYVNDQKKSLDAKVGELDKIVLYKEGNSENRDLKEGENPSKEVMEKKFLETNKGMGRNFDRKESEKKDSVKNRKRIKIHVNKNPVEILTNKWPVIFTDIFDHIDFDRKEAKGKLVMTLNGRRAGFLDELQEGDHVEIYWT
ncbi:cell division protein FtsA [Isachenkonia alkalipeptolytica]|uniref:Cell division protein FtsA n=1 Tax=Isachenkonia alkalipeptolytica TaxID=2565777 RepID=A0AA44BEP2_9CLOT|nr:cell division FtsA domain-containing protein [Isachenkonia alkalipeptolytica]NBG89173.1 cell division protein FtsA [Isachenkonia alkalipeptolytica]